ARDTTYVVSEYWDRPTDRIGWRAKAVRLFLEAACEVVNEPGPANHLAENELFSRYGVQLFVSTLEAVPPVYYDRNFWGMISKVNTDLEPDYSTGRWKIEDQPSSRA
ncbi:hypothetical protein, partial [Serratia marcescens]|uniref:hypothetical protein n=1 Tax=Serratia marcescens TaxID=615 RepID=UPI0028148508